MPFTPKAKLPRLAPEFYRGRAAVLWTHTMECRATGWLHESFHGHFREVLLHTCCRYALATPCYVLMPDHWHLVWLGLAHRSDQRAATAFLRKHVAPRLGRAVLQDRAHDHVLREAERTRGAFRDACSYVRCNPERAGLCRDWRDWPFQGALISGFPRLDFRADDFWETFWKIHNRLFEGPAVFRLPAASRVSGGTSLSRESLVEEETRR